MNSGRVERWLREHYLLVDCGYAVLLGAVCGLGMVSYEARLPWWFVLPWTLAFFVAMALRRRATDLATGLLVLALLVQVAVVDEVIPPDIVIPFLVYAVGAYGRARWRRWWLASALVGALWSSLDWSRGHENQPGWFPVLFGTLSGVAVVVASYVLGALARQRRQNVETLRSRADALEREQEQTRRLAAQEERNRIAREMHDIVAHSLSVIVVQADGARYLAQTGAGEGVVEQALGTIGDTARTALAETRRLVGVLREDGAGPDYAPSATLDQIEPLVTSCGVPARYSTTGVAAGEVPAAVQMALYRVAQEAVTNVLKHTGPGATLDVTLAHAPGEVRLTVTNTGAVAADDGAGHGLVGMRERMAALGGALVARPRLGSGFEVVATVPLDLTKSPEPQENS